MFQIYNKSSEEMKEIADDSIDLVICDPPCNVGTVYVDKIDSSSLENYKEKMNRVLSEIKRKLNQRGVVAFVLPKAVKKGNKIISYPELFIEAGKNNKLNKLSSFDFKITEQDFSCKPINELIDEKGDCHSAEIEVLVLAKEGLKINEFPKNKLYYYQSKEGHPCPYPKELINDLLDTFYKEGDRVLDPFMGTGGLGKEVLKKNGEFFGYELEKKYFETAKNKLENFK